MKKYSEKDFKPAFDFIESIVGPNKFPSGVFGVVDKDGIIDIKAFGNRSNGLEVKMDDIYLIFSVTKVITGIAIMQLCDKGKIHLNEPVSKYMEGFESCGKENVTIWHLLTHTSGLQQGALGEMLNNETGKKVDMMSEIKNTGLDFQCGSYKTYNPFMAFCILGEIIKRVSGLDPDTYMKKNIFDPLGMKDTSFNKHREVPERIIPIINDNMDFNINTYGDAQFAGAGLFSTATDLLTLSRALLNGGTLNGYKLISAYSLKEMITPQTIGIPYFKPGKNLIGVEIGLAMFLPMNRRSIIKKSIYGHNGAGNTMLWVHSDEGVAYVFMTNYDFNIDPEGADIEYIHNVFTSCLG